MATMKAKERNRLPDAAFGIPSKRMYPLYKLDGDKLVPDKAHIESAARLFGHASNEDKPQLAKNILKAARAAGIDSSGWTEVNKWAGHADKRAETKKEKFETESAISFDSIMEEASNTLCDLMNVYNEYYQGIINEYFAFVESVAYIRIGDDILLTDEDFESFYAEADIHCDDDNEGFTIEFTDEIVTELARGPYDEYLRRHGYDPKTNTIIDPSARPKMRRSDPNDPDSELVPVDDEDGNEVWARVSAGAIGSKKQRNRMNAFLKRNNYDPETGTIETGLLNPDGTKQRVPFGINTNPDGERMIYPAAYTLQDASHGIAMEKGLMQRRPAVSTGVLQHEIGHIASQLDQNPYRARDRREAVREISQADPSMFGNSHGISPDEYVADRYALRHNPYDKSGTTMTHSLRDYLPDQQTLRDQTRKQMEENDRFLAAAMADPRVDEATKRDMEKARRDMEREVHRSARRPDEVLRGLRATRDLYAGEIDDADDVDELGRIRYQVDQLDDMMQIGRNISSKSPQRKAIRKHANQEVDALRRKDYDTLADLRRKGSLAEYDLRDKSSRREAVAQRYIELSDRINAATDQAHKLEDLINSGTLTPAQQRKAYRKHQRLLEYIDRTIDLKLAQSESPEVLREPKRIQPSKQERAARKDLDRRLGKVRTVFGDADIDMDPVMHAAITNIAKQLGMTPKELADKAANGELPENVEAHIEELFDRYDKTGDASIFGKELEPVMAAGKKVDEAQTKRRAEETKRLHEARDKARAKNPDRTHSMNMALGKPNPSEEKKRSVHSAKITSATRGTTDETGKKEERKDTSKKSTPKKDELPVQPAAKKDSMTVNDQKEPKKK